MSRRIICQSIKKENEAQTKFRPVSANSTFFLLFNLKPGNL